MMSAFPRFEVPIGRDANGGAVHWNAPGCRFVTAYCTVEAFHQLGGHMYGVAVACIEEIALIKVEAKQSEPNGSVLVSEEDLVLLSSS
jgi:hypothetical protein